jgi:dTDP-4-dehydrorhamnose reductase
VSITGTEEEDKVHIAIIGCNGQLGRELLRQGKARGVDMVGLDYPEIDIRAPTSIDDRIDFTKIALVVNAAAYTAVDKAESEPDIAFAVNRQGPANLANRCRDAGIPLIHISTDYVFDGTRQGAYIEDDPIAPLGVYGKSKAAGEGQVRQILPEHIIVRTAWLCGVHGSNFVKTMLRLGRENPTIRVVADQYGCPTIAADLANALIDVSLEIDKDKNARWGTYHYCGAGVTSWYGFATAIFEMADGYENLAVKRVEPIATADFPTAARRPANSVLDCSKIGRHFGVRTRPWRESLAEMIRQLYTLNGRP